MSAAGRSRPGGRARAWRRVGGLAALAAGCLALLATAAYADPRDPAAVLARAEALRALHRSDEASRELDRAQAAGLDDAAFWRLRGRLQADEGDFERALACFDRALARAPDSADADLDRATMLQHLGRSSEARAAIERAALHGASRARIGIAYAQFDLNGERPREAAARYTAVLEAEPASAREALIGRAAAYDTMGETDRALADVERAFRLGPGDDLSRVTTLGLVELHGKRYEAAVAHLTEATRDEPASMAPWLLLAQAQTGRQAYDRAAAAYARTLALRPDNMALRARFAEALFMADDHGQALQALDRLLATGPTRLAELCDEDGDAIGRLLFAYGRYRDALPWLDATAGRDAAGGPSHPYAALMAYLARVASGDRVAARAELGRLVPTGSRPWVARLADYFMGRIDEPALRAAGDVAATDRERAGHACEADYYLSLERLVSGQPAASVRPRIDHAMAVCPASFTERHGAAALVARDLKPIAVSRR